VKAVEQTTISTTDANKSKEAPRRRVTEGLKEQSIRKIQRIARRAKAMKMAQAETQWKMFADLDTQDEAEMLHLAVFMQTLLENIPDDDKDDLEIIKKGQMEDDSVGIRLDNVRLAEKIVKAESSFRIDPNDFELGDGNITMEVVADIMDIYKKRGRLSRKSVVKILRKVYKVFQKLPNVTKVEVEEGCKITLVGDLHGQLSDLIHILEECGMPSPNNKYVFNGDFVDRGNQGLEVVVILFALFIAAGPDVVCLNRGNHEDLPVCRVYGFEVECKTKYDDLLFEMFAEVFSYLPLFCLVNRSVFIVHGGLFHTPLVSIDELEEIQRNDYYVKPQIPYPQCTHGLGPEDIRKEFMKQLQRDALWSDPTVEEGCYVNPRGAGVSFGPDIAAVFMKHNQLSMVVRSHEMVFRGFDLPFAADERTALGIQPDDLTNPPNCPLLITLFSASNYTDADNEGAFMTMMPHYFDGSVSAGKNSGLFYSVRRYKTSVASIALESSNKISLSELILKKKSSLMSAFEAADPNNLGIVSRSEWAEIMQRITLVKIRWLSIINKIAPAECLSPTSVAYKMFMQHFSLARRISSMQDMFKGSADSADGSHAGGGGAMSPDSPSKVDVMDDMYGQRKKLESIFYFFDTNGDGVSIDSFQCASY
jgi:serine/threonine-protein phosphatase with EF-hand domain